MVVLQAEQQNVSSDSSAVPASGSDSRSNIRSSIYQLVVGLQAYRREFLSVRRHISTAVILVGYRRLGRT